MRWHFLWLIFFVACGGDSKKPVPNDAAVPNYPDPAEDVSKFVDSDAKQATDVGPADTAKGATSDVVAQDADGSPDSGSEPADVSTVPDQTEPIDVEPESDVPFFDAGQVDPGGSLDKDASQECESLGLAEEWEGTFDGKITANLGNTDASGTMSFEISCFAGKFIVSGDMTGLGEGQPFNVKLQGTYNPNNKTIKCKLIEGNVLLLFIFPIAFEGELEGVYDGVKFVGDWNGENTDKTLLDAKGAGTWDAQPK